MPRLVTIADGLKDALNGHAFSVAFVAERKYEESVDLTERTLQVFVRPRAIPKELIAGDACTAADYVVETVIFKPLEDRDSAAETDPLVTLAEEVAEYLLTLTVAGASCARVEAGDEDSLYEPDSWWELSALKIVIRATFRVHE